MSQDGDKSEEEFSNWAKTVLGLMSVRDGSIKYIKGVLEEFAQKLDSMHGSLQAEHFKELLIKVTVNGEVKKVQLDRKNPTKINWVLESNNCTTCEKIFEKQLDSLEDSWCFCKKWICNSKQEQVEPSSYWWILAKMYIAKSKIIDAVGPEEVEPLAIFNLIKRCKLFDSKLRSFVDVLVQLRHRLMHSANNQLTEKEMKDNFCLIKDFLGQIPDNPTETINKVEKLETSTLVLYDENGEYSKQIKEALQQQEISLNADLKSPEGIRGAAITSLAASNRAIKRQELKYRFQLEKKDNELLIKELKRKNEESEKTANQYKINALELELQRATEKNKAYEDDLTEFKKTISNIEQEFKQRKTEFCMFDKMEKEIKDLTHGKIKQDDVISSLTNTMVKGINDLKQEKSKHDDKISFHMSSMAKEINDLKEEKRLQDVVISSLMSTTRETINDLKQEKIKHDEEISSLKSKMEKEISDLKQEKSKQDDEICSLKSTMMKEINDLKQEKGKQDDEISYLKRVMKKGIKDLNQEKSKQKDVISSLTNKLLTNPVYQVLSADDVNVRVDYDKNICYIIDICQMSDGTVILIDNFNKKLKRLDDKYNVKDFYQFDKKPISVVSVSLSQVVVLDWLRKLTYLTILENIEHEKIVDLKLVDTPQYMIYCRDQFWICCYYGIRIYSLSGAFVKQILNDFIGTANHALTTNEEKTRVYYVHGSTVKVLDPGGEILSSFQLRIDALAITVTTDDRLMVVESESDNVVVYDTEGKNLGVLISGTCLLSNPLSLLYDGKKGCLIVGLMLENKVQVFQLNK